jgi:hypothetical protein
LLIFDDGNSAEDSTLLPTDRLAPSDKNVLATNFDIPPEIFNNLSQNGENAQLCNGKHADFGQRNIYSEAQSYSL